jgi:hypothetical protein
MEETPQLVHSMNVTERDGTYWFARYQHVSVSSLVFVGGGYDEEHGDELWSLTYAPRTIDDSTSGEETDDASSEEETGSSASPAFLLSSTLIVSLWFALGVWNVALLPRLLFYYCYMLS